MGESIKTNGHGGVDEYLYDMLEGGNIEKVLMEESDVGPTITFYLDDKIITITERRKR
jgi:hypothetical protein|tara:strand:+ start:132 stop:305 length:174 start_codon:yes stop_codon:yes gene_type:complete